MRFWKDGPTASLIHLARRNGVTVYTFDAQRQRKFVDAVLRQRLRPDLLCIGTFPSVLSPAVLELPSAGAINVHMSLLPKHRGPDPLFWTYLGDDRETGVTVHWLTDRADAGDIVLQRKIPLERGRHLLSVYCDLATIGGELIAEAVTLMRDGRATRTPQDESQATSEPSRSRGGWRIDFEHWQAERVWHVVRGLTNGHATLLSDSRGSRLLHGPAVGYSGDLHDRVAGTIVPVGAGFRIYCVDGTVDVAGPQKPASLPC